MLSIEIVGFKCVRENENPPFIEKEIKGERERGFSFSSKKKGGFDSEND